MEAAVLFWFSVTEVLILSMFAVRFTIPFAPMACMEARDGNMA